jgi:signal recognition particle GTPase
VFDKLSTRLAAVVEGLRGRGRLSEENIGDTLRQVRMALLEADVALPVVKDFIDGVKARVVGQEIHKSLTPGQALIRIIHDELVRVMGEGVRPLNLRTQPPAVILLAGLQGAGKTTTAAKIGLWLKDGLLPCCSSSGWVSSWASTWLLRTHRSRPCASQPTRWRRPGAASTTCCSWIRQAACTWTRK